MTARADRPATMAELMHATAGEHDADAKVGHCTECGGEVTIPGDVVEIGRIFNRRLHKQGVAGRGLIGLDDLVVCGPECRAVREAYFAKVSAHQAADVRRLLVQAKAGDELSPAEIRWLHEHGAGPSITAILEGDSKASGQER